MLPGLMLKPDAEEEDGNAILKHRRPQLEIKSWMSRNWASLRAGLTSGSIGGKAFGVRGVQY